MIETYKVTENGIPMHVRNVDVTVCAGERTVELTCEPVISYLSVHGEVLGRERPIKVGLIKKVIFNAPVTIVYWADGAKTIVRANDEEFDPEKGLAMAIAKKHFGNKGNYYNEFKKWIK